MGSRQGTPGPSSFPLFRNIPEAHALAGAVTDDLAKRGMAIAMAKTFGEVVDCIPTVYREPLRIPLRQILDMQDSLNRASSTLRKLKAHKAAQTFPSQLAGVKEPVFQVTKGFLGTEEYDPLHAKLGALTLEYKNEALDAAIALKQAETLHLTAQISSDKVLPVLIDIVTGVFEVEYEKRQIPKATSGPKGEMVLTGEWEKSPAIKSQYQRLCGDLSMIVNAIMQLEQSKEDASIAKEEAKKKLKAVADVEMADAQAGATLDKKISDAVQAAFKKFAPPAQAKGKQTQPKGKGTGGPYTAFLALHKAGLTGPHPLLGKKSTAKAEKKKGNASDSAKKQNKSGGSGKGKGKAK
ncbi:hypothetical protein A0H81_09489 [Grifola frondosa]|uniref:Uncharacterized protein n=1 Tax=Grifola frondosa TaxID=5627 RepID=A0A1C7M1X7_GRIFR|nr:hypothetical protein A0H81_09489 [Grifola frondosa]